MADRASELLPRYDPEPSRGPEQLWQMCSAMEEEKNTLVGITCIFTSRDCKKECTMRLDPHEDGNVITLCLCREP